MGASNVTDWGYNITVGPGGIDAVTVSAQQATISALPYTATLSVVFTTGGNLTVPVQGTYQGFSYSPIVSPILRHGSQDFLVISCSSFRASMHSLSSYAPRIVAQSAHHPGFACSHAIAETKERACLRHAYKCLA